MSAHLKLSVFGWRWLTALPVLCCISCSGSGLNPVQGKVLYKDQPIKGVLVTLHPKDNDDISVVRPTGLTAEDGSFTLTTGEDVGALAGQYVVTFLCSEEVPAPKGKALSFSMGPEYEDRFKGTYAEKSSSKVEVEVRSGPNQLEPFHLK